VSDTQAYKQFGNSVVVPVLKEIAKHMAPWIKEEPNKKKIPTIPKIIKYKHIIKDKKTSLKVI
jgi:hypothetical protein